MRVLTDPFYVPHQDPPAITVHALKHNRRPVGFAPWPEEPEPKKKRKRRKGKR